ncbi:hypothetical protein [Nitrobacter sp. TKz-YC02]|uniref:hypothetical protein n=1 Tax=Nitrobacter sp. TKz-YC02 TaxID=3398704 RepID=UPI003CEA24F0
MDWNLIGWLAAFAYGGVGVALPILFPEYRSSGYFFLSSAGLAGLLTVIGLVQRVGGALRTRIGMGRTVLIGGLIGTWLFLTFSIGVAVWLLLQPSSMVSTQPTAAAQDGPLTWYTNLSMEGGPPIGRPVYSLTFLGQNTSQKEVALKSASIISLKSGRKIDLEVIAQDNAGDDRIVPTDEINLIPPGAPIKLIAKFGDPDPNAPGKIRGLESKTFLETWSQFHLSVKDDTRSYRLPFNEGSLMAFFPGMVGPHITTK